MNSDNLTSFGGSGTNGNFRVARDSWKGITLLSLIAIYTVLFSGCYSYYGYKLQPDSSQIADWRFGVTTFFCEYDKLLTSNPVTIGNDTLFYKWVILVTGYWHPKKSQKRTTKPVVDSIQFIDSIGNVYNMVDSLWGTVFFSKKGYPNFKVRFGPFDIPIPYESIEFIVYISIVDYSDESLIDRTTIHMDGELKKIRKVWTGN